MSSRACYPEEKDRDRHDGFLADKKDALARGAVDLVFIGDSITDAWRQEPQFGIFEKRWGRYNPYNIGLSGDETQHVVWRLQNGALDGLDPKLVVVMIGTNNIGNSNQMTPRETATGIRSVVGEIQKRVPNAKILLLGVFPRGESPRDEFRGMIQNINRDVAKLDDGGKRLRFVDIGENFLEHNGSLSAEVAPDELHLSEVGYQIWADAIEGTIREMIGK
jgi:beta-glucosidase